MKKVLSVFLAVLMMFSVMSVLASAGDETTTAGPVKIVLNLNGCALKNTSMTIYNNDTGEVIPNLADAPSIVSLGSFNRDAKPVLPRVEVPDGKGFIGWREYVIKDNKQVFGSSYAPEPAVYILPTDPEITTVYFIAEYGKDLDKEEILNKILGILSAVFGTIINLFNRDSGNDGVKQVENFFNTIINLFS